MAGGKTAIQAPPHATKISLISKDDNENISSYGKKFKTNGFHATSIFNHVVYGEAPLYRKDSEPNCLCHFWDLNQSDTCIHQNRGFVLEENLPQALGKSLIWHNNVENQDCSAWSAWVMTALSAMVKKMGVLCRGGCQDAEHRGSPSLAPYGRPCSSDYACQKDNGMEIRSWRMPGELNLSLSWL